MVVHMPKKKKLDEKVTIFKLNTFDGSLPKLIGKTTIKKSKKSSKKRDPQQELETAMMDSVE